MDPTPAVAAPTAEPAAGWFRQNAASLATVVALAALVCYYLHPLDVLIAGFGMSLIIFLHELGHFAAAKLCDVHVKTFSIGFGPALPFCSAKYGETTYKLALIPLGGFVSMVGEGDDANDVAADDPDAPDPAAERDPRSFANKPVWQRMVIISAGVVMNILLAAVCFVATYLHGVDEKPAVIARVQTGEAGWRAGIHAGTEVKRINGRVNPWFDDIRPIVSSTGRGETVELVAAHKGVEETLAVEPTRSEGDLFPLLGVTAAEQLVLREVKRDAVPPVEPGSAAARAGGFQPGDRIVAMSDPDAGGAVTPVRPDFRGLPGEYFDYYQRLARLAEQPVEFHVVRKGDPSAAPVPVRVEPDFHVDLGVRMRMGPVVALRTDSPAARAGVRVGDRIVSVSLPGPSDTKAVLTSDPAEAAGATLFDPMKLPHDLAVWAGRQTQPRKLQLTVLRDNVRQPLDLDWDDSYRDEPTGRVTPATPVAIDGLGLAYQVLAVVDRVDPGSPAAAAGLKPADEVTAVRYKSVDHAGNPVPQKWVAIQPHHWAFVWANVQVTAPHGVELKLSRDGQEVTADLTGVPDPTWGQPDRGVVLTEEKRTQKAATVGEALEMGAYRTYRKLRESYQSLYGMVFGRISVFALSGPLTMAQASYFIAGKDVWHLLLYMGMVSVSLAVTNFLPVPVLDGGHMMFLSYEAIRGKPAPVAVQAILTYVGLALILSLMLFVVGLDVYRLAFA